MKWIDIKEQVPPTEEEILVYDKSFFGPRIMSCIFNDDVDVAHWFNQDGYIDDSNPEITHWQKLPGKPI